MKAKIGHFTLKIIALVIFLALAVSMVSCNQNGDLSSNGSEDDRSSTASENYATSVSAEESVFNTTNDAQETEKSEGDSENSEVPTVETDSEDALPPSMTFEAYNALTGAEQRAYMDTFPSIEAFFDWYNEAKAAYESTRDTIEYDGSGDLVIG